MNLTQLNDIGIGAVFPIVLSTPKDAEGNDRYEDRLIDGVLTPVKLVGWYPSTGLNLVKNNITSIFIYQIGERFRQENFGSRLWECIEEPNTQLLEYMVTQFIKQSLSIWEDRVVGLKIETTREGPKLFIQVTFSVNTSSVDELILEYDNSTNTSYAYQ